MSSLARPYPRRRSLVKGVAWSLPVAAVATSAPAFADSQCVSLPVTWTETIWLSPGSNNPRDKDKNVTDCGDVAIDGWTKDPNGDAVPQFRAVVGTYIALQDVTVTISVVSGNLALTAPSTPVTPAQAATPCPLRNPLAPLNGAILNADANTIVWNVGSFPALTSAQLGFSGTPSADNTDDFVLTITLTGTKGCDDEYVGPCAHYPGACDE